MSRKSKSYSIIDDDTVGQRVAGLTTILLIGFVSILLITNYFNPTNKKYEKEYSSCKGHLK